MNTDNIQDIYGLSPMQQGMLFHSLYAPRSGVYCIQFIIGLSGSLDPKVFKRAWQELIDRHAILRTAFFWEDLDKPLQVVRSQVGVPLENYDWRALTPAGQEERLQDFLKQDRERGFDLSEAPLMRLALIHLGAASFKFIWSHHHLLLDGWSAPLLFREFFTLYQAFERGEMVRLEHSRPYRDYIAWLQQQDFSQAEIFWRKSLKGFTTPTPLINGRNGSALSDGKSDYDEQQIQLPETLTSELQEFARQHRLTLNTLTQGAWALLLSRYSGEEEVLFGVTTSGRPPQLAGSERMIGLFINTLPVRVRVSDEAGVGEWLQGMQEQQAVARQYEYSPLVAVQGWSEVGRGVPLFESIFVFENYPVDESLWEQKEKTKISVHQIHSVEQTNYPLSVIAATGRELTFRVNYEGRRFDRETIKRMLVHLQVLLEAIVADPGHRLSELPLLSSAEQQQILYQWNDTKRAYPAEQCLHELIEEQVERTPEAVALVYEDERLSYRELNARANQLAHHLGALGVGAESVVGVLLERSIEMVVTLLGVLKAGGAYVPLDPEYPQERLSFMAADAGISWLLTQEKLREKVRVRDDVEVISVDAQWEEIAHQCSENVESGVSGENLAYVIYTSGSTGRPKGVMITHRAITNRLQWMQQVYGLDASDTVLQKTSFSFDVSVWEFFWPLLAGARLVLARPGGQRDAAYLVHLIRQQKVTTMHFVPSMLQLFLQEGEVEKCGTLRRVICSGEALSYELQERFHGRLSAELHNLYGPTEAAVDVTSWACERDAASSVVPIGRPIANIQTYVLDRHLQPVPVGVTGELYLGGVGLSRGYLKRADLTAERFLPHPFSNEAATRIYRTGDLARYLSNGALEYVGRVDHQVKVRGHRIELGEVEAALSKHSQVNECVVVAREETPGETRLIAYFVSTLRAIVTVGELRNFLKERLPEHMIPSVFVEMKSLPLTASGKVDRKALPAPEAQRPQLESAFSAPYTRTEELLVEIWSEVLKLEQVGVDDDFFELGGDSILSLQIGARARLMGLDFSIQELFGNPTIRKLARKISADESRPAQAAEIESTSLLSENDHVRLPGDVEDAYPLSQLQAGMIFHSEYRPETAVYHDIFTFHIEAQLDLELLKEVLQKLVARHPVLRTSFDLTNFSEPLQLVHRMVDVPFELEDLRHMETDEQERFLSSFQETEKGRRFDWRNAPLLRFYVHRRTEESFQFTLSFHHAILDGWSVASMLTEIFQHYAALVSGRVSLQEPSPPSSLFRDFVALERATIKSEECRRYWRENLRDSISTRLPRYALTHEPVTTIQTRTQEIRIPAEVFDGLKQLAWSSAVPLKSVLLAAHLRVMSLLSGKTDVLTGLVSNGRPEVIDGERVLGLFLNTLPFRFKLSGGSWADLVRATFDSERELLSFRRYPMAQIQREQSGRVLFETGFNFNHFHVYRSLPKMDHLRVVGGHLFESTNYTFSANFGLDETSSQLQLILSYNAGELNKQQVAAFGSYYAQTLSAMASDPEEHYESLSLLSNQERQQILHEWNETSKEYPSEKCLHELFEQQNERTPNSIALLHEDEQLSYAELNQRSNQLAHHLRTLGVRKETLVGVLMERSVEMVVALLGILKAGGAYVPLDPEYPQQRLSWMVEDSGIRVLLTQERLRSKVALDDSIRCVCVDTEWEQIARQSVGNMRSEVSAENLAYVIYTSGSTGRPNAVLITHQSPCNLISDAVGIYDVRLESRVLQISSLSFDAAVLEIFLALTSGARLYVASAEQRVSGQGLARLIEQESITTAVLTPSTMRMLGDSELKSLKVVSSGGERCSGEMASRWSKARRLLNCYGPTEATVFATYAVCDGIQSKEPPIGRPIANTEIYILDHGQQPVPVGVTGELYIGGDGLARGYHSRADLTAERFLPHPFSAEPGARLYRTGDVARYLPSGKVEYVGRTDEQVKVRGYRIELGELEATLRGHEGVSDCVVVAREEPDGEQRLIAYVVAEREHGSCENDAVDTRPGERDGLIEFCPSVAEYFVYDDLLYHTLTNDVRRNDSYKVAISEAVRDKVVLDIGTGPEAVLARFCVEAGARKVYAIEILEQTYQKAVACVRKLGLEDKISLVHGDSTSVRLPERVDVCVSEIVGSIGGSEGAVSIINDARRFMKTGGLMIPRRSVSRVAAVQLPDEILESPGFTEIPANYVERIFEQVGYKFDLRLCIKNFPATHLLSDAAVFEDLDFSRHIEPEFSHEINLTLQRDATLHGFLIWLNLYPAEAELIDTLQPGYSWFPIFFPVFLPGVKVCKGETIKATCSGRPSRNQVNPDYRIEGTLFRSNGEMLDFQHTSPHHDEGFRKTPFYQWLFPDGSVQVRNKHTVVSEKALKKYLRQRLPGYMTPHAIVLLDELPLTPVGKVDRRALLAAVETRPRVSDEYVAPRTPVEERLAEIWSQLLGIEQISVNDNFFDLGGHSLLATQLITSVREAFRVELPLRDLFEAPVLHKLAERVERAMVDTPEPEDAITPVARSKYRMNRAVLGAQSG